LVLLSREFPLRQLIDDAFSRHGVTPRIIMEMNSSEAALSTVRCGPLCGDPNRQAARQGRLAQFDTIA